jgi:Fanconi anemia group M protein
MKGLDIGEVDLIVCFDAQHSPTRLIQRMGRTGRKRAGRCVMLLAEGIEENVYRKSQSKKTNIGKAILQKQHTAFQLYEENPRMVPEGMIRSLFNYCLYC